MRSEAKAARAIGSGPFRALLATLALGAILAASGASGADDPVVVREMASLQGIWTLESMEVDGRKATDEQIQGWVLVIEGDQYNPGQGLTSVEYTYHINPNRNPKAIDLFPHEGAHRDQPLRGVYKLKDDRLTVCRARTPEVERPAGYRSRPDSGLVVSVWKRRKR